MSDPWSFLLAPATATPTSFTQPDPWQTIADTAADALNFGTSWIGWQQNPSPPPDPNALVLPQWARNSDKGNDVGFRAPQPTSPNDNGFTGYGENVGKVNADSRYNGYWTGEPQNLSAWDRMWQGTNYQPEQPPQVQDGGPDAWSILTQPPPPGASW